MKFPANIIYKLKNNKLLKSVATVTVFSVLTRGISFLFKIYLSRKVGAEVMGLYQISVTVFYLFAGIAASGLTTVVSRKTAEDCALGNKNSLNIATSALLIGSVSSAVIIALLYIFQDVLPYVVPDARAIPLFLIMAPALLTTGIYNIVRAYFWGKKDFTSFSITETVEEIFRIIFTMLFVSGVVSGISGAQGIALAFTISDCAVALILFAMFFIKGGRLKKPTAIKELLVPSLPVTGVRVFGSLISTVIALLLPIGLVASGLSAEGATAVFGRITGMANPLLFAPNAIISSLIIVLIPDMSANNVCGNSKKLSENFSLGIKFSALVSGIFMAVYLALGKELCEFLFEDAEAGIYLQSAALLMILSPISSNISGTLNSIGKEKEAFFIFLLGTALLVPSVWLLTPIVGMHSIVIGNGLSLLASISLGLYFLRKHTGINGDFLIYALKVTLAVLPASLGAELVSGCIPSTMPMLRIVAGGVIGVAIYVILAFMMGLVNIKGFIHGKNEIKSLKPVENLRSL